MYVSMLEITTAVSTISSKDFLRVSQHSIDTGQLAAGVDVPHVRRIALSELGALPGKRC